MKRIFAIIICLALMSVCFCGCAEDVLDCSGSIGSEADSSKAVSADNISENEDTSGENSDSNGNNGDLEEDMSHCDLDEASNVVSDGVSDENSEDNSQPEEVLIPTEEDFEKFYKMMQRDWVYSIEEVDYSVTNMISYDLYSYFGYKTDYIKCQIEYADGNDDETWDAGTIYVYDWDDPLDKFHFNDEGGALWFGDVTVYDAEALIWIGENVFGKTPELTEDDYRYCYDGKYYVVNWGENIGHPGIFTEEIERSYERIGNNEYRFYCKYYIEDSAIYEVDVIEQYVVAKIKYSEIHGTYWQFISRRLERIGTYTSDEYFGYDR